MKTKFSKMQIARFITQLVCLFLLPGLFVLTLNEIQQLYIAIGKGNSIGDLIPSLVELLVIIPMTMILGRFFCGWICAFGTFNDLIYLASNKLFKVKFKVNEKTDSILKYMKYIILLFNMVVIWTFGSTLFNTSSPWDAFAQLTSLPSVITQYTIGFVLLVIIAVGAMFIERFFCRYLCPLGAVFTITSKLRFLKIKKVKDKCGNCRICTNNCSMGIPLYKSDKVSSGECINCYKCIDVCPRENTNVVVANENISPALASAVAITAFAGIYSAANFVGGSSNKGISSYSVSAAILNNNSSEDTTANSDSETKKYNDGTYVGQATGYKPGLQVQVTVKDDKITDIEITANNETPRFTAKPFSQIPAAIIESQSTEVDAVSGATRTSVGIMNAVKNALNQALVDGASSSSSSADSNSENSDADANTNQDKNYNNNFSDNQESSNGTDNNFERSGRGGKGRSRGIN